MISAAAALQAIKGGERFDVILCDLMMPQMTGMEFFATLEKLDAAVARTVVFMTGGTFTPQASAFLATAQETLTSRSRLTSASFARSSAI